jgi:hypothetical protein
LLSFFMTGNMEVCMGLSMRQHVATVSKTKRRTGYARVAEQGRS